MRKKSLQLSLRYFIAFILIALNISVYPQSAPKILWQECLGDSLFNSPYAIKQTFDNGYILVGYTESGFLGKRNAIIFKLDFLGRIQWEKILGGSYSDYFFNVEQTRDSGYIAVGSTESNDGDVHNAHGLFDVWVVKFDKNGKTEWENTFGGSSDELGWDIHQTKDGGCVIAAKTQSNNDQVSGNHSISTDYGDFWLFKIDSEGKLLWQKCYGGKWEEWPYSMQLTNDGGYIMAGYSTSNDGDVSGHHGLTNSADCWIVKIDSNRNIQWQKSFGGSAELDQAEKIYQTGDGGYIVGAQAYSMDGDITNNHGPTDFWLLKLKSDGSIEWQKCYGGSKNDDLFALYPTLDGGYIAAGRTTSSDGDVKEISKFQDVWVIKVNSDNSIKWQNTFGGSDAEHALSIIQNKDSSYIFTGETLSTDGDIKDNHGFYDIWVVKLDKDSIKPATLSLLCQKIYPDPARNFVYVPNLTQQNNYSIVIYDVLGRRVYIKENIVGDTQIDCSRLASGLYFISELSAHFRHTCKLIKIN